MRFPRDRARAHIERLEQRHGIEVRLVESWGDSEAIAATRQVFITDPTTPMRYLVALHEFGHLVDKVSAHVLHAKNRPEREAAAWRWAVENAEHDLLAFMTPRLWAKVGACWVTSVHADAPDVR